MYKDAYKCIEMLVFIGLFIGLGIAKVAHKAI